MPILNPFKNVCFPALNYSACDRRFRSFDAVAKHGQRPGRKGHEIDGDFERSDREIGSAKD